MVRPLQGAGLILLVALPLLAIESTGHLVTTSHSLSFQLSSENGSLLAAAASSPSTIVSPSPPIDSLSASVPATPLPSDSLVPAGTPDPLASPSVSTSALPAAADSSPAAPSLGQSAVLTVPANRLQAVTAVPAASPTPTPAAKSPAPIAASQPRQSTESSTASLLAKIAAQPQAKWFGDWNSTVQSDVSAYLSSYGQARPVLVAYNIPQRDCGSYSSGGASSGGAYMSWINAFAAGIGQHSAIVILEPDALAAMDCLSSGDQSQRLSLIRQAVQVLKGQSAAAVYVDAGHPNWILPSEMANRLTQADSAEADGFSLNVSNFYTLADNLAYGNQLSALVGGKHYVVDTSRNGNGPASDNQWCNPSGRALGALPTFSTGQPLADAYLWIKNPGESDGNCNGGPNAGVWWPDYAAGLARNAGY